MREEGARLSRRAFTCAGIGAGMGALGLSRFARAQAPVPDAPQNAALAARVDAASHLTLNVTINGQGPFRFVVDTGAERSVIADNVAAALQLPSGPSVTVDVALVAGGADPRVLLIRRKHDPFAGRWALPGGFVDENERLIDAARRELKEETGLDLADLEQLHTFGDPGRDPRGWTVSVVYLARVVPELLQPRAADDADR